MVNNPDFETHLSDALELIDETLAQTDVELRSRPLRASKDFVKYFVKQVSIKDGDAQEPGEFFDYMTSEWFKVIFARVTAWYRARYGEAMNTPKYRPIDGCLLIFGTPFLFRVPHTTSSAGKPGETFWLRYHDEIQEAEVWQDWIVGGPTLSKLSRSEFFKAQRIAHEVGANLRVTLTGLMSLDASDDLVSQLRDPIMGHLERAASLISAGDLPSLKQAQWDLQMASELSLKMLSQQKSGCFTETHDLYCLYDRLPHIEGMFDRHLLKVIPPWQNMTEWRYGGGDYISVTSAFARYRATLKIARSATEAADRKLQIWNAGFELKKAPFLHDDLSLFKPS